MKNIIKFGFIFLFMASLFSCDPRIEMDMAQWGDNAFINNVQLFKLETKDGVKLEEYYVDETTVTGTRKVTVSSGTAVIDEDAFTATVTLNAGETFTGIGFLIYHYGTKVEPLNGAPVAGIINDLSAGSFTYRVHSADGTTHDWTINVVQ
ncbi:MULTISPECIES: DUF5018-related domain-containing protein [unclassified Saccharicrinis]|uniref:DUF5018-related domain-containing protein n=1 Tax=unclassified Saccharicrinis TaxID=2646859 RepID=UPI003D332BF4